MEIEENSRLLFMKYALPCMGVLVKRGKITQETVDRLFDSIKNGKGVPESAEKITEVAFAACSIIAIDNKKEHIDKDVIREYFLFRHDEMVDKRYDIMGDFDQQACRTRPGRVLSVSNGEAIVENSLGKKNYRTDFLPGARSGDLVVTHWNFIVEKIGHETAQKMAEQKEAACVK